VASCLPDARRRRRVYSPEEAATAGYEDKDLGPDGAPFYLAHGIVDVVVVDPRTGVVFHFQRDRSPVTLQAPVTLDLTCGCSLDIP